MAPTGSPTVAIDVTPLLGARTGIGSAVAEVVRALSALDDAPDLIPYTLSFRARQHRADAPAATRFVPIPARILLKSWTRREMPRIDRWLRPAQVLHATNYLTPPSRLPTLVTIHDCAFVRFPDLATPEVRRFEPVIRRALRRGASVHTPSAAVADEVREIFGPDLGREDRVHVIPWGRPPAPAADARLSDHLRNQLGEGPYVLAIGTIEPRKNIPQLAAAFAEIAGEHADLRLVLAGAPGPDSEALETARQRAGADIRARILVPGIVSDADKQALLAGARVFAYPSLDEGFGLPLLEAMAASVPIVATRAGSIPEVAGDAALLVAPGDQHALATALVELVTDEETRGDLIARGAQRLPAFDWERTARALSVLYRSLG